MLGLGGMKYPVSVDWKTLGTIGRPPGSCHVPGWYPSNKLSCVSRGVESRLVSELLKPEVLAILLEGTGDELLGPRRSDPSPSLASSWSGRFFLGGVCVLFGANL